MKTVYPLDSVAYNTIKQQATGEYMRIGASSSEINNPSFLLVEHRGEPITLNDLALIADSLPKRGPLNKWQQALAFAGGVFVLAACAPASGHEGAIPSPTTTSHTPTETPHIDPTATALHPTEISITPSPFVTAITPEVIQVAAASLPPAYVAGTFDILHLPEHTRRVAVGTNTALSKELSAHHLVPIEDGAAASYQTSNNRSYAAMLGEVFDKASSQVLKSNGAADEKGIVSYTSPDGLVTQYFPSIVPCEEGKDCFTVVSFDPSDSSVTYWVQVDHTTGKLEKYMPAIYPSLTELNTALKTGFRALEKDKWGSALHGSAALAQTGEVMGVSYEAGDGAATQGGLMFMVTEDNKNVVEQARNKDITWKGGVLSAKNENGTFVWDHNKSEWMQAVLDKNLKDGAPVYQAGDKQFISVDGNLQPVTVDTTTDEKSSLTMQDGTKQVWDGKKWITDENQPTSQKIIDELALNLHCGDVRGCFRDAIGVSNLVDVNTATTGKMKTIRLKDIHGQEYATAIVSEMVTRTEDKQARVFWTPLQIEMDSAKGKNILQLFATKIFQDKLHKGFFDYKGEIYDLDWFKQWVTPGSEYVFGFNKDGQPFLDALKNSEYANPAYIESFKEFLQSKGQRQNFTSTDEVVLIYRAQSDP